MRARLLICGCVAVIALALCPAAFADDACETVVPNHARSDQDAVVRRTECDAKPNRVSALSAAALAECGYAGEHYQSAVKLHDMGDYDAAWRHYNCALHADPDNEILLTLIENLEEDIADAKRAWQKPQPIPSPVIARESLRFHIVWFATADCSGLVWRLWHQPMALAAQPDRPANAPLE